MGRARRRKLERTNETHIRSEITVVKHEKRNSLSRVIIVIFLISALASLIYSNTFSVPFFFDDIANVVDNPAIKHLRGSLNFAGARFIGYLSFALNYRFGGLDLFGYHLINLMIHIVNAFFVYTLVLLVLKAAGYGQRPSSESLANEGGDESSSMSSAHLIALIAALLFVTHPVQTQAVTYIVQRFTTLSTLFYLLSVVFYLKWRLGIADNPSSSRWGRWGWYAAALLSCVLAMKTKQTSFTLPFMIILMEIVFFRASLQKRLVFIVPFLLLLPIILFSDVTTLESVEVGVPGKSDKLNHLSYVFSYSEVGSVDRWSYLITQFRVIVTYLRLLFFPAYQNLDYDYPVYNSLLVPSVFVSFLFLLSLFVGAIVTLWRTRAVAQASKCSTNTNRNIFLKLISFGVLWFFITLSVESSIIPIRDVIFEHRIYLPSFGFFLVIALLAAWGWEHRQKMRAIILSFLFVIVGLFSVFTYQRNQIWKDPLTLWKDVVEKSPKKERGHINLAAAYRDLERFKEALEESEIAVRLKPDDSLAHQTLGIVYSNLGRLDEAIEEYQTAIRLKPNNYEAHNSLGVVYADKGQLEKAIEEYQTAIRLNPYCSDVHSNLASAYQDQGLMDQAFQEYKVALRLKPDSYQIHYNLGVAYRDNKLFDKAVEEFRSALKLKPDDVEAHNNLGLTYVNQGRFKEAIEEYQAALLLKPDSIKVHNNLGAAYGVMGQLDKAIEQFQAVLILQPDLVETRYNLGRTYQVKGMLKEARREFQEVLKINPEFSAAQNALNSLDGSKK